MIRYCFQVPGSVGFVVSQDGDVRVMTRVGDDLVYWDSIRLQYDEFVRQRRRKERINRSLLAKSQQLEAEGAQKATPSTNSIHDNQAQQQ